MSAAQLPNVLPNDFTLSQSSLQDYVDCARRFKLRYIEGLRYPALSVQDALAQEERLRQGARFHKVVQQHLLGVPADVLARSLDDDAKLAEWWQTFMDFGLTGLPQQRHAETTLQTYLGDYRLIAKYDLLAIDPQGQAVIVDWKTSAHTPSRRSLKSRWQTTVYRYVLAQAGAHLYGGDIPPEKIRMIYCFVALGGKQITFDYSEPQMQADEANLLNLIGEIEAANLFPLTSEEKRCRYCCFRSHCNRGDRAGKWVGSELDDEPLDEEDFEIDFDQIAEIEF